ncbi:hypothetical protein [Ascidiimonas aurantiaca]|uniref:hypothetical protein n=1 Tax=Ascidiimonas aurantiaca TaxID=1685432 RepID=UPI0030EC86E5
MRKRPSIQVKAGALQFVVFIAVVIALLLMALISYTHVHGFFKKQTNFGIEAVRNADIYLQKYLLEAENTGDTVAFSLFEEPYKSGGIKRSYWGVLEKVTVTSAIKKSRFTKMALVGGLPAQKPALYLEEKNRPLILVGNTRIEGDVFLPAQGVRPGNISGNAYYLPTLIYGRQNQSSAQLPALERDWAVLARQLLEGRILSEQEQLMAPLEGMVLQNSFSEPPIIVYAPEPVTLSNAQLTGQVMVVSRSRITVEPTSRLTDVVLVAPEIYVKKGTVGTFQGIASKGIFIEKGCRLIYPSALVLLEETEPNTGRPASQKEKRQILLSEGSFVSGVVAYLDDTTPSETPNFNAQIVLEEEAVLQGQVYCEGNFELLGTVEGNVYTSGFVVAKFGSVYQNHIFNGKILSGNLPPQYSGFSFKGEPKKVMKWLY